MNSKNEQKSGHTFQMCIYLKISWIFADYFFARKLMMAVLMMITTMTTPGVEGGGKEEADQRSWGPAPLAQRSSWCR